MAFAYQHLNFVHITFSGIAVSHEDTLYATVIAVNKVGLSTQAASDAIVVDNTPPLVSHIDLYEHKIFCECIPVIAHFIINCPVD